MRPAGRNQVDERLHAEVLELRSKVAALERQAWDHQRAEEDLRRSEELNRRILQSMLGGLVLVGLDGTIMSANAEAERVLGLAFEQLNSRYVADFGAVTIHEDGSPYAVEDYPASRCLATGEPQGPVLIGLRHADGSVIWAVYSAAPLIDPRTGELSGAVVNFIDVTEVRDARETVRRQGEILQQIHDAVIETDLDGIVRMWNDGAVRLYGYTAEEAISRHISFLYFPEDVEQLESTIIALQHIGTHDLESRVRTKDGEARIIHLSFSLLRDRQHRPNGMVGYSIDITDRKIAEEQTKASQAWFESLVNTVDGIVWEADVQSLQFTFVSHKAVSLLGYSVEQWLDPGFWLDHLHPDDRNAAAQSCQRAANERRNHEFEYRMIAADGRAVWLRDIVTVVEEAGQPAKLRGLMVDITESKQAQEKLRFQAALLDSVRESVIATDLQGRVIYWGRGAEALYGYSEDEVIGRVVDFIVDPSQIQDERERMKVVLATGTWSGQYEQRRKDGSTFYADTLLSLVSDDRGQPIGFIGIDRDITEQRLYQDALRQSADTQRLMLQELDHRVRNNLAALAALIDIFRKSHTNVPAFAEAIRGRVQAMSVVHSLLSRARWEAVGLRRLVTTLVPADLHDRLTFEGDDAQIPPRQMTAMGMVLQELIANSLKYGCLRESTGSIRLTCNAVNHDGTMQLQLGWQESGGPRIESTPIGGQGSELIRGLVKTELRGEVELSYLESGACHQFTILLDSH